MKIQFKPMAGLMNDPCLYSTVQVGVVDQDLNEVTECLYDEATEYWNDIAEAISNFHTNSFPTNDLMCYFSLPDDRQSEHSIRQKIQSACLSVFAVNTTLFAKLKLSISADLTAAELEAFAAQIESQYKDGWGADFESQNITTRNSDVVYLRLYHDDLCFYTGSAFDDFILKRDAQARIPDSSDNHFTLRE